jgi:two-component system, cell cycle response regulator
MIDAVEDSLFARLKAENRLPSSPGTAIRVVELCRQRSVDLRDIADAIMSDPALSARLLKYANSPLVGAGRAVTSVREAVLFLGLRTVKVTALGFSLAAPGLEPSCKDFDLRQFWRESFLVAVAARQLATAIGGGDREEAFTAGQLSQIGRLAFAHGAPKEYTQVLRLVRAGRPLLEAEQEILGTDHSQLGALILAEWGLPEVLVRAVQRAWRTDLQPGPEDWLAYVVHLALQLMPVFGHGDLSPPARDAARAVVEDALKLAEPDWQRMAQAIQADYREAALFFDINLGDDLRVYDLYAAAQEEAGRVTLAAQLRRERGRDQKADLLRVALQDRLTGAANRACFDERVRQLTKGLEGQKGHFALLMMDVDHFERLRNEHGPGAADVVLRQVAQRLQAALRDVDLLARYGERRFTVLAPCTDRREACVVAVRACRTIERTAVNIEGRAVRVTISVGLVLSSDYDIVPDAKRLMEDVERQLRLSRKAGRNTWSYLDRTAGSSPAAAGNCPSAG